MNEATSAASPQEYQTLKPDQGCTPKILQVLAKCRADALLLRIDRSDLSIPTATWARQRHSHTAQEEFHLSRMVARFFSPFRSEAKLLSFSAIALLF